MTTWQEVRAKAASPGSTILTRWKAEREAARAVPQVHNASNGAQFVSSSDPRIVEFLGGNQAASGYPVNAQTAMRVSAVYACIARIAGAIASLPVPLYERTDDGRKKVDNAPLWWMLNEQPHPIWSAAAMWEWVIGCNCLRGDAFIRILRNAGGQPNGLLPLHPDTVTPENAGDHLVYYIQPRDGSKPYGLHQDDLLHIPNLGFDGLRSPSVIRHAAMQSIGIALAADDYSGKLYANGAMPKHAFFWEGKVDSDQIDLLQRTYAERYTGSGQVGKPMVLSKGVEMKELSMTAVDAELLESRKFQVIDIARAFGVPPHMIGATEASTSWGTGIEQQTIGFVKYTIQPYLNRIEQELNRKLFRTARYFVEFQLDGLMRGDYKSRNEGYRIAAGRAGEPGWMTINEIRRLENLPPIAGGDELWKPDPKTPSKGTENAQASSAAAA
jgi:phage portal protein, HK97 family